MAGSNVGRADETKGLHKRMCVKISTKAMSGCKTSGEVKHAGFNRKTPSLRWRGVVKDITFSVPPSPSEAIWLFHPL